MGLVHLNFDDFNYINIKEVNCKLKNQEKEYIERSLRVLQEKVPIYSLISLKFQKEFKDDYFIYTGKLTINTTGRTISSSVSDFSPIEIYKKLEKNISKQIMDWKKNRFNKHPIINKKTIRPKLAGGYEL